MARFTIVRAGKGSSPTVVRGVKITPFDNSRYTRNLTPERFNLRRRIKIERPTATREMYPPSSSVNCIAQFCRASRKHALQNALETFRVIARRYRDSRAG